MKPLPSKDEIRQWISDNPGLAAKRDIAKAFGIKGDARIELKALLRELEGEGVVEKSSRRFREPGVLPPVAVLQVLPPDAAGDLYAKPLEEGVDEGPRILVIPKKGDPALGAGDRILARLTKVDLDDHAYEARLGVGSMGLAFFCWDIGMKRGDVAFLGVVSYAAPVLSTLVLVAPAMPPRASRWLAPAF